MYKFVFSNKLLPSDRRLQFHLSHQVDQASPAERADDLIIQFLNDNIWPACVVQCSPHLQPDWAWRSRETPRSFISLLAKQTLLTSGTRLTICTLKRSQQEITGLVVLCLIDTADEVLNDLSAQCRLDTYSRTRCSNRSLRTSRTRWTLQERRNTSKGSTITSFTTQRYQKTWTKVKMD